MKFTLKLQIDSATELANFIQDINMEIDLPFLTDGGDAINFAEQLMHHEKTIKELQEANTNYEEMIMRRDKRIEEFKTRLNITPVHSSSEVSEVLKNISESEMEATEKEIEHEIKPNAIDFDTKPKIIISTIEIPRSCLVCGNPVPPQKKTQCCSTKCYGTYWARENASKKAKSLQNKSD